MRYWGEIIDYKIRKLFAKGECDLGEKVGEYGIKMASPVQITGSISTGRKL